MGGKKKKEAVEEVVVPKKVIPIIRENWIMIHFKLLNWKFMNFSMKFRETTHIFTLKKLLQQRHGRVDDLRLCFNQFTEINEIKDEMLTLKECGLKGGPEPEPIDPDAIPTTTTTATVNNGITKSTSSNAIEKNDEASSVSPSSPSHMVSEKLSTASISIPAYQLFYDFKPTNYSDPIILYYPK